MIYKTVSEKKKYNNNDIIYILIRYILIDLLK
jgi:hypothetical protein